MYERLVTGMIGEKDFFIYLHGQVALLLLSWGRLGVTVSLSSEKTQR
jgi:hypothetical protein